MYQASWCGSNVAAGRYGDARVRGKSTERALRLHDKCCFLQPGSGRSFALTVQSPPHTPDVLRRDGKLCAVMPSSPPGSGNLPVSSSWPRDLAPFCSPRQQRQPCVACAHASEQAIHVLNCHSARPPAAQPLRRRSGAFGCPAAPSSRFCPGGVCLLSNAGGARAPATRQSPYRAESWSDQVQMFRSPMP